jgi:tight adherence protein C
MFSNDYIAYAMIAVGIFTFYMAIVNVFRASRGNERIKNAAYPSYVPDVDESEPAAPSALLQFCEKFLPKIQSDPIIRKQVAARLMLAGITAPHAVTYVLFCRRVFQPVVLLIGLAVCYWALAYGSNKVEISSRMILGLMLTIFGLNGTDLYIANCIKKREQVLTNSFPEVMDLLLVCIEAGLGLDAAFNRVCKELRDMHPEVIAEFDRTRLELTMLGDRVVALQNLAERTSTISFSTLVSSLIQTEKFGTSLVDTLRVLSEEQRLTRLYTAEQKAARIPVLITIPLILFIMPAFIMIILGPPIVKTMNQMNGVAAALPASAR